MSTQTPKHKHKNKHKHTNTHKDTKVDLLRDRPLITAVTTTMLQLKANSDDTHNLLFRQNPFLRALVFAFRQQVEQLRPSAAQVAKEALFQIPAQKSAASVRVRRGRRRS